LVFQARDGPVSASATITITGDMVDVELTSLENNPTGVGQLVSGIFITLSSAGTSDSLSGVSGNLISIAPGGVYSSARTMTLANTHWGTSLSASTICLETAGTCALGMTPDQMFIGSPGPGNLYSNANSSITNNHGTDFGLAGVAVGVPGPTAGAGLPGLALAGIGLFVGWRRRRRAGA
jgi:MYXO-CTERM domain-containing protein